MSKINYHFLLILLRCQLSIVNCQLIITSFLILISASGFSQESFTRQQKKMYEEADIYLEFGDYHTALERYEKLYKINSGISDLNLKIGQCLFNIKGRELQALDYFEKVKENEIEALFFIARINHLKENFEPAISEFLLYKSKSIRNIQDSLIEYYIEISQNAKKMIDNPVNVSINNLGSNINSAYQDYVPLVSADESVLYFTSRRNGSTGNLKDPLDEYFEDIYVSRNENNHWTKAENIGLPVNSHTHDATVSLSSNGNTLIFYRTNEDLTAGDLYIAGLTDGQWSAPEKLSANINSEEYQEASACLSPDERTLFFSSNRTGGFGGKDLYRVTKLPNGSWSLPVNMGPGINSKYDEDAPFMHIDGKTLYFSSNGHNTIGGYDVFKTTLESDSLNDPQNLGYPINTVHDDIYFTLNASGTTAYYSTQKERGFGKQDIYKINLNGYDEGLTVIKGNVRDSITQTPLRAIISIIDEEFGDLQGIYYSNSSTGNYILTLEPGKSYQMVVEAEGYKNSYIFFKFSEEKGYEELSNEIFLQPE